MSATSAERAETGGVDLGRLDRFMAKALTGDENAAVSRTQLSGGLSQMTIIYQAVGADGAPAAGAEQLVVRVPPAFGPLEPYDPVVEATLMTTVGGFGIAVPEVALLEGTGETIGRPFYATRFVPGAMSAEGVFGPGAQRETMAEAYVDQLVALHNVPIDERGAAGLPLSELLEPMPAKTCSGVLDRWSQAVEGRNLRIPVYQQFLREWLLTRIPEDDGRRAVVHGDYRLANMLWNERSEIAAAMDWEEAGLGDPYSDLAWTLMGSTSDDDHVLGLASRGWIVNRYASTAGIELDRRRLFWWEVASGWTRLCMDAVAISWILEGRYHDIRPLLSCYLNRRIAATLLRTVRAYEEELA